MSTVYQIERAFKPQLPRDKRPYDLNFQTAVNSWAGHATNAVNSLALVVNVVIPKQSPYSVSTVRRQLIQASASAAKDTILVLPAATGSTNEVTVKKIDGNAHNIVVNPRGLDTIDGVNSAANSTITILNDAIKLVDALAGAWVIVP